MLRCLSNTNEVHIDFILFQVTQTINIRL